MEFDERRYRPLSTIDLFDEAFDLFKRNFLLFMIIAGVVYIPLNYAYDVWYLKWGPRLLALLQNGADNLFLTTSATYLGQMVQDLSFAVPFFTLGTILSSLAMADAASERYLERPTAFLSSYASAVRGFLPAIVSSAIFVLLFPAIFFGIAFGAVSLVSTANLGADGSIIDGVVVGLLLLVFLIASIYPLMRWSLFIQTIIVERCGPIAAIKRSSEITKGYGMRMIGALSVLLLLSFVLWFGVVALIGILTGTIFEGSVLVIPALADHQELAESVAESVVGLILVPFQSIFLTLLYFDQRIRTEGYDMEILAQRLNYPKLNLKTIKLAAATPSLTVKQTAVRKGRKGAS